MRGKALGFFRAERRPGITPACAGKSLTSPARTARTWNHPRVCGEKRMARVPAAAPMGSPPRVRGKVMAGEVSRPAPGITPACAGKSEVRRRGHARSRDHPRVCGEKPVSFPSGRKRRGSPPRVRGKVVTDSRYTWTAGKSSFVGTWLLFHGDHPRVCGEKGWLPLTALWWAGSPPRVRGKGSSMTTRFGSMVDHPRVCGEKFPSSR